jgi:2-polyprenyl-6-methoxyphenol hydroxylase-like FAD-dependent oxidoreductase
MTAVRRALVIGGGIGGMSAALCLRKLGAAVDLIEKDPAWRVYGAGITITGASLRAFDALGVLDAIRRDGHIAGGVRLCAASGQLIASNPPASDDIVHSGGGIMRPSLHGILSSATRNAGVEVSLGVSVTRIEPLPDGVSVELSDGRTASYDLVVGADGIYSQVRRMLFASAPTPQFTGQGCWRIVAQRSAEVDRATIFIGGPYPLGLIPVSSTQLYMFVLQHVPDNDHIHPATHVERLRDLLAAYGGDAARVRDAIDHTTPIVYRPLEAVLLAAPWHRGRVVLLGDAVHATTPHLATGAGLAVEDALVLAEELASAHNIESALDAYSRRRYPRCKAIVENSIQIGRYQLQNAAPPQIMALMQASSSVVTAPW